MNLSFETDGVNISYNSKGKETIEEIATPIEICRNMSNLFDYTNCNQKIWMDLYCKTGNMLQAFIENGVSENNIIAVCDNKQSQMFICRKVYNELLPEIQVEVSIKSLESYKISKRGNIYCIDNWSNTVKNKSRDAYNIVKFIILKEMEKTMQLEWNSDKEFEINNVIMNPPYNSDIYIDFVLLAKKLATDGVVAITPAKWGAKGGDKNELFRNEIVPYIREVVFYPEAKEVFDIGEWDGITYYYIDKNNKHEVKSIKNICKSNSLLESDVEQTDEIGLSLYKREIRDILKKIDYSISMENNCRVVYSEFVGNTYWGNEERTCSTDLELYQGDKLIGYAPHSEIRTLQNVDKYKVITSVMAGAGIYSMDKSGKALGSNKLFKLKPNQIPKGSYTCLAFLDSDSECDSYISYFNTKLVSFLVYIGVCGTSFAEEFWRYIPKPEAFDHKFTDEELYKKYNLTDKEIALIEGIIKERK